jgi:hypothetical protein
MFNFIKGSIYEKIIKKNKKNNDINFDEINVLYKMLIKYKKNHPCFNLKRVMLQLYPKLDWKKIISNITCL